MLRRVPTIRRAIRFHSSRVLGITNVGVRVTRHDHAKLVSIGDIDDVIHGSSRLQHVGCDGQSGDREENREGIGHHGLPRRDVGVAKIIIGGFH